MSNVHQADSAATFLNDLLERIHEAKEALDGEALLDEYLKRNLPLPEIEDGAGDCRDMLALAERVFGSSGVRESSYGYTVVDALGLARAYWEACRRGDDHAIAILSLVGSSLA